MLATGSEVILKSSRQPRGLREEAAGLLAVSLLSFARHVDLLIRGEEREMRRWLRAELLLRLTGLPADSPGETSGEIRRRMKRIAKNPLPHARRQIARLLMLLDGEEFQQLKVSREVVVAVVEPARLGTEDRGIQPFRICFVPRSRAYFPVVIRFDTPAGPRSAFRRFSEHGACWGEARPMLDRAVGEADVYHMFIIAFTWALSNLR